jgi:hypothetical protein
VAVRRGILTQHNVVMGKVVALRILKRQLDVVKLGIGRHVHRQTRPGKVTVSLRLT